MQSITILCPSPLEKDKAVKPFLDEYIKRISAKVTIREVPAKIREHDSPDIVKTKQGEALLAVMAKLPKECAVIVLDENGQQKDSIAFSQDIEKLSLNGHSALCFIIGGGYGLSQAVIDQAHLQLSFGRMVWPHRLVSIMLLEQLYRAQQISKGHPYHKA